MTQKERKQKGKDIRKYSVEEFHEKLDKDIKLADKAEIISFIAIGISLLSIVISLYRLLLLKG